MDTCYVSDLLAYRSRKVKYMQDGFLSNLVTTFFFFFFEVKDKKTKPIYKL